VVDNRNTVAQPFGLVHVVSRHENRAALFPERTDDVPELAPRLGVEPGGGLVQEEKLRVTDQRASDGEALLLSA
jgi:hypothetical protein